MFDRLFFDRLLATILARVVAPAQPLASVVDDEDPILHLLRN